MLVIHPKDKTTAMLSLLYEGIEHTRLDQSHSNKEVRSALNHVPPHEYVLLLGHGSERGLLSGMNEEGGAYDRLIVNASHGYYLRRHGARILGIWCHAHLFAKAEGLHGLFTGMIISELSEAQEYNIATTQAELDAENVKLAERLRMLLDGGTPIGEIPQRMAQLDDAHTPLTQFNYSHFYYL